MSIYMVCSRVQPLREETQREARETTRREFTAAITTTKPEPEEYFDEVSGNFRPSSVTESEDSGDSPKLRRTSDCESEDSFIVFEDSPDSFHTYNDVFGETIDDSEENDSDSDMSVSLSKSVCNLASDGLYAEQSEDEVDCAIVNHRTVCKIVDLDEEPAGEMIGLLIDNKKKLKLLLRKNQPAKKVSGFQYFQVFTEVW